jgi:hypothetical protein
MEREDAGSHEGAHLPVEPGALMGGSEEAPGPVAKLALVVGEREGRDRLLAIGRREASGRGQQGGGPDARARAPEIARLGAGREGEGEGGEDRETARAVSRGGA